MFQDSSRAASCPAVRGFPERGRGWDAKSSEFQDILPLFLSSGYIADIADCGRCLSNTVLQIPKQTNVAKSCNRMFGGSHFLQPRVGGGSALLLSLFEDQLSFRKTYEWKRKWYKTEMKKTGPLLYYSYNQRWIFCWCGMQFNIYKDIFWYFKNDMRENKSLWARFKMVCRDSTVDLTFARVSGNISYGKMRNLSK